MGASSCLVDAIANDLIALAYVPKEKIPKVAIFLRVLPELKDAWVRMCNERGVKQNLAGERLAEWIVNATPEMQGYVLAKSPLNDQALASVVESLRGRAKKGPRVERFNEGLKRNSASGKSARPAGQST